MTGEPDTDTKPPVKVWETEVTVPLLPPEAAIVIAPEPFVIEMPEPAVRVALDSVLPVLLPINSCPSVKEVWPVPPLATGKVPVTPVERGKLVALVSVPEDGVPSAPPLTTNAPAEPVLTAKAVPTPVPRPDTLPTGKPVQLVSVPAEGVPKFGVVSAGEVANTSEPVPVSSLMTPASSAEVVAASADNLSVVITSVLDEGIVVPFTLVAVAAPMLGVVNEGEVANTNAPEPVSSLITPASSAEVVAAN